MSNKPQSPADPRPDNRPAYINPNCPKCGTPLVLLDLLENQNTPEDEIWYDEFVCPKCNDGLYIDAPKGSIPELDINDEIIWLNWEDEDKE